MTEHDPTLYQSPGKTTITCSCGQFTKTASFGGRTEREEHLKAEHWQHVKETK